MAVLDNQAMIGTILPNVHYDGVILESGGDLVAQTKDDPHINDMSIYDQSVWANAQCSDGDEDCTPVVVAPMETWSVPFAESQLNDTESISNQMTAIINLSLKEKFDPDSGNVLWLLDQFFLKHVKLVVIQMAAHHPPPGNKEKVFKSEFRRWLRLYNKSASGIYYGDAKFGTDSETPEYHLEKGDAIFESGTDIRDYHVQTFTLLDVVSSAFPQYVDIFKQTFSNIDPNDSINMMSPAGQKHLLETLLTDSNNFNNSGESQPLRSTQDKVGKTINIPFQVQFNVANEKPSQLCYMAFTYFDFPGVLNEQSEFPDIDFENLSEDPDLEIQSQYAMRSPGNVKHVIRNGKVNKRDTIFLKKDGKQWFGNIVAVPGGTTLPMGDLPLDQTEYDYTGQGINYYTDNGYGTFNISGEERLTLVKKKESIINDFRSLKSVEKVFIEFKNYQNDIMSSNLLGDLNNNIKIPERTKFSDMYLSLGGSQVTNLSDASQLQYLGHEGEELYCYADYFFAIDVGAILEKNSLFPWVYGLPLKSGPMVADKISTQTNTLLQHAYSSCRIKNFSIKRQAVQTRRLNTDYSKEYWEAVPAEDPDCHTDGYIKVTEGWENVGQGNQWEKYNTVTIEQGSISNKKVSPVQNYVLNPSAEPVSDFSLDPEKEMECEYKESQGVAWAGYFKKQINNLHLEETSGEANWPGERSKMLFIEGQDRRFPTNGQKRFQYGVQFEVVDGFINTLKAALGEPGLPANEIPLPGGQLFSDMFQPLITGLSNSLEKIKKDIDQGLINMGYGEFDSPVLGYPNDNFVRTAPVIDPVTNSFTEDYLNSSDANYAMAGEEIEMSLLGAIGSYFGLLRLFSTVPSYDEFAEGASWNVAFDGFGMKELDDNFSILETYQGISPSHGGSAKGFMLFYKMYNDMIYMIRNLIKHSGTSGNSFLMGGGAASPMGQNSNPDIVTTDPGSKKPALNDNIKVDHWFQQTLVSPSFGLTGYSYLPYTDVADTNKISIQSFDSMINSECLKYFQDPESAIPALPLNDNEATGKQIILGMTSDSKHNYVTLRHVWINGVRKDLDVAPKGDGTINNNLDLTKVKYTNTLLQMMSRAEISQASYPRTFVDEATAYDESFSKDDQVLLSKMMLGRSCVVNPQISETYINEAGNFDLEKISYSELFLTVYDWQPLDSDDELPDDYYGYFSPGKYGNDADDYSIYGEEKLRMNVHLLMTLLSNDEFAIFKNFNHKKWMLELGTMIPLEEQSFINQIYNKDEEAPALRNLPNPIKYLIESLNILSSLQGGALPPQGLTKFFNENNINEWLTTNVLNKYFLGGTGSPGANSLNTKDSLAALYFNFFNIGKIEYLAGFESASDHGSSVKKYSLKAPKWRPLTANGSTLADPDALNNIRGKDKKILCRVVLWDGYTKDLGQIMNLPKRFLSMPVLTKYFYIESVLIA